VTKARPAFAVVLVATNERGFLMDALASLWDSRVCPDAEVVVVDNASDDGTAAEVARRWPQVTIVRQTRRRGLSINVNAGICATTAPFVMVCNSDVVFGPESCARLVAFMETHPRAALAAPRLLGPSGEVWPAARRWYTPASLVLRGCRLPWAATWPSARRHVYADWDEAAPRRVDWVPCAATMLRREALSEIGLMDERFRIYFGDVDLALRAHNAGWEVWAVPDAEVVHHWRRASRRPLSPAWFSHLASLARFVSKHGGLRPRNVSAEAPDVPAAIEQFSRSRRRPGFRTAGTADPSRRGSRGGSG
jgi:GT2 family glycosyltransferase